MEKCVNVDIYSLRWKELVDDSLLLFIKYNDCYTLINITMFTTRMCDNYIVRLVCWCCRHSWCTIGGVEAGDCLLVVSSSCSNDVDRHLLEMMRAETGWCQDIVAGDEICVWSVMSAKDLEQLKTVLLIGNRKLPELMINFPHKGK